MNSAVNIKLNKKLNYDYTPTDLISRAEDWYHMATDGIDKDTYSFSEAKYVAFCFSIEFMLKALLCIDDKKAVDKTLRKYKHDLGKTKDAVLESLTNQELKNQIEKFFNLYPEFNDRDLIDTRYGRVGFIRSYSLAAMTDGLYKRILSSSRSVICSENAWWRNPRK